MGWAGLDKERVPDYFSEEYWKDSVPSYSFETLWKDEVTAKVRVDGAQV